MPLLWLCHVAPNERGLDTVRPVFPCRAFDTLGHQSFHAIFANWECTRALPSKPRPRCAAAARQVHLRSPTAGQSCTVHLRRGSNTLILPDIATGTVHGIPKCKRANTGASAKKAMKPMSRIAPRAPRTADRSPAAAPADVKQTNVQDVKVRGNGQTHVDSKSTTVGQSTPTQVAHETSGFDD